MIENHRSSQPKCAEKINEIAKKVADSSARLPQIEDGTPEQARAFREERGNPFAPKPCELDSIEDVLIPIRSGEVLIRIYKPLGWEGGLRPGFVFYHGGGFVLGDVNQYDTITQHIAAKSKCIVISVDYKLAPENKIKSIHRDGFDAYVWVWENAKRLGIDLSLIHI